MLFFPLPVTHQGFEPIPTEWETAGDSLCSETPTKNCIACEEEDAPRARVAGEREVGFGSLSWFVPHTQQDTRPLPALGVAVAGLLPFSSRAVPLCLDTELQLSIPALHSGTVCLAGPVRVAVIRVGHRWCCGADVSVKWPTLGMRTGCKGARE